MPEGMRLPEPLTRSGREIPRQAAWLPPKRNDRGFGRLGYASRRFKFRYATHLSEIIGLSGKIHVITGKVHEHRIAQELAGTRIIPGASTGTIINDRFRRGDLWH
jgi:hypothetical protein